MRRSPSSSASLVPRGRAARRCGFTTSDGLDTGGHLPERTASTRVGVLVFCHEYLSDRWSYRPYADGLRDEGFDVFTFDFRNHGASGKDGVYQPLQWVTDHEVNDLRAALSYVRSRPDHDPAGFGLFGISRGGGTALAAAADERDVWGVITDGAFPTRGTMRAYINRWAEIYIQWSLVRKLLPPWFYRFLSWVSRIRSEHRLHCKFPDVEKAVARIAPRPWLLIHGEKDAYIGPQIARRFFAEAKEPKELWIVPRAKHNRCREMAPDAYAERVQDFYARYAPRRPIASSDSPPSEASWDPEPATAISLPVAQALASHLPG